MNKRKMFGVLLLMPMVALVLFGIIRITQYLWLHPNIAIALGIVVGGSAVFVCAFIGAGLLAETSDRGKAPPKERKPDA